LITIAPIIPSNMVMANTNSISVNALLFFTN